MVDKITSQPISKDGYYFEDVPRAAHDMLDMLRAAEARDALLLNREGQRELIALLGRLLDD